MEGLEQKFADLIESKNKALTEKMEALNAAIEKGAGKEELETLKKEMEKSETAFKTMQEQVDKMAIELKKAEGTRNVATKDALKALIVKNFEKLAEVSKTNPVKFEQKDMTLSNALTGDQPREYNNDVVVRPAQLANVEDLARPVTINGGTYTFVRSTLASGAVAAQTEGSAKAQLEYDYATIDANTDFIAGFAVYSRKMRNNLPFLESTLALNLRRDYYKGENSAFQTILAAQATDSAQIITGKNKVEMLVGDISDLATNDFMPNAIVVRPSDYYGILLTEKSTGAGYGLPGIVTFENGIMRINGIVVTMATWLPANKYYVGDWSRVTKVITEGFSFAASEEDSDNFRKNNITARVEAQVTVVVEQPAALLYGDFTAVA